jgi:hypothetical protein
MRVDTRPRKRNAPRIAEKSAPGFLQWLRGRNCVCLSRGNCSGKIEAAHVDYAGDKGMGSKVRDSASIPLCTWHHAEQHRLGWKTFEAKYPGVNALQIAEFLWSHWPGRIAWERKLNDAS